MKKRLLIIAIAAVFTACGNGSESDESSTEADSTINSTTPPPTVDSTSAIGTMMGDTSTVIEDSIQ